MIRGAIAYGLVLRIPSDVSIDGTPVFKERGTMITTALSLVIVTTVVFGSIMPILQRALVPIKPGAKRRQRNKRNKAIK